MQKDAGKANPIGYEMLTKICQNWGMIQEVGFVTFGVYIRSHFLACANQSFKCLTHHIILNIITKQQTSFLKSFKTLRQIKPAAIR